MLWPQNIRTQKYFLNVHQFKFIFPLFKHPLIFRSNNLTLQLSIGEIFQQARVNLTSSACLCHSELIFKMKIFNINFSDNFKQHKLNTTIFGRPCGLGTSFMKKFIFTHFTERKGQRERIMGNDDIGSKLHLMYIPLPVLVE